MKKYDVAAIIWPAFTQKEKRARMFWPEEIGEWQTVKNSTSKFPGHDWPRRPLWGYVDEAEPRIMEMEIETAVEHGVNVFIYDWYWYDGRPMFEDCLNEGFLKARNRDKMQFYLMWANHDFGHYWDINLSWDTEDIIWRGDVSRQEFEKIAMRWIDRYFTQPNYYKINGCPVFWIYELHTFIKGMGGEEQAKDAIAWLREKVREAGFPDIHLQTNLFMGTVNLSTIDCGPFVTSDIVERMGIDSLTHYQFVHYTDITKGYESVLDQAKTEWKNLDEQCKVPYYPGVSIGWDNNPRFKALMPHILENNTPENFEKAVRMAKDYIDQHPERAPLIVLNSWNEWLESSYLVPDDLHGYGYLEAVKRVFG